MVLSTREELNAAQRRAVEAAIGPVLVLAGPGSGKTRVITSRIVYLAREHGVNPINIMAVTFTNKAANEMRQRLQTALPGQSSNITLGTFHAICARLLRRDGHSIGIDATFSIYDETDQLNLIRRTYKELGLDEKTYKPSAVLSHISAAKSELQGPHEFAEHSSGYFGEIVSRVYRRYQAVLGEQQALDFDDLLMSTVRLFRQDAEVLARYQDRYQHILVDEFQDTNKAQYAIVRLLAGKHRSVFAVGDEDQSIYSWRNADIRNILDFRRDFPEAQMVLLEQNYRSSKTILEAAQKVIASNAMRVEKRLWTDRAEGAPITVREAYDEQEEASYVVSQIGRILGTRRWGAGDIAVMYRVNAQSRALEDAFRRGGLPYRLVGTKFYDRREIRDVLAYLRVVCNPRDLGSLLRVINVPPRGVGQRTVQELTRWASARGFTVYEALLQLRDAAEHIGKPADGSGTMRQDHPFSNRALNSLASIAELFEALRDASGRVDLVELIALVVTRSGYMAYLRDGTVEGDERWENVKELQTVASDYRNLDPSLALLTFLEEIALVADVDEYDKNQEATTLLTLHSAKGLEFPVVFLVGMEDGLCPHMRSFDDPERMEEERRLCYVGMTRAADTLFLTYAFRRRLAGGSAVSVPSRYLSDIPRSLLAGDSPQPETAKPPRIVSAGASRAATEPATRLGETEMPSFVSGLEPGTRVRHSKFGEGVVVAVGLEGGDEIITALFPGEGGMKKLLAAYAHLQRL